MIYATVPPAVVEHHEVIRAALVAGHAADLAAENARLKARVAELERRIESARDASRRHDQDRPGSGR